MHTARCSDSASPHCDCECGGQLHGTRPGVVYRWVVETGAGSADPQPAPVSGADEVVIDVLAELVQRSAADLQHVGDVVEEVLAGQAWQLMLDRKPPKRRLSRRHWLCSILGDIAAALDEMADLSGALGDAVYDTCHQLGWGPLRSKVAAQIVERLADLAFTPALAPVSALAMKVRIAALIVCPDAERHEELTRAFASDLYEALGMNG